MKKILFIASFAILLSGQSARETQQEVPTTKTEVVEAQVMPKIQEAAPERNPQQRKSAAKRSMESETTSSTPPKGAAKLAVEREL